MSEAEVTADQAEDFTEYLIHVGGYVVDPKTGEIRFPDGSPAEAETSNGPKPIMAYRELTKLKQHLMLNIFSDADDDNAQLDWFYQNKSGEVGVRLQTIMKSAIAYKSGSITDENEYVRLSLSAHCPSDKKLAENFEKILPEHLLSIFYAKANKTCQLHTQMFDPEYRATLSIPQKHWVIFEKMMKQIFKFDDVQELYDTYKFTSALMTIPGCESKLRVYFMALRAMEKYMKAFIPDIQDMRLSYFEENLSKIQQFYSITKWVASPSSLTAERKIAETEKPRNPLDPISNDRPGLINLRPGGGASVGRSLMNGRDPLMSAGGPPRRNVVSWRNDTTYRSRSPLAR